ncbi:MAG: alcohol dehydrogenase [Deltaproteobacteria bacterium HGW-Deltaproteobacteria-14]|nr:MAG: alcohol dehydrogenase [Deltaproteobacteria bacterium HGW-Deltaproteobacteria-14]
MIGLVNTDLGPRVATNLPDPAPSGEALLRLSVGGVCATDIEIAKGYMGFRGVMGHEWVGVVEAAPDPAWVGRRVVGDINCPCGACATCAAGRPTHCPHRTVLGIEGRDGAFSERFTLPLGNLHAVPDAVSDAAAVFVEPLAAALEILEQVHVRPSDRVVVLGTGRLGQLCARVLALTGAEVTGVGRDPGRLKLLPPGIARRRPDELAPGRADVVVDCTGAAEGLSLATTLVRPRGTVVLKTTVHDPAPQLPTPWVIDEIHLVGSRCGPFAPALRLLASGAVDPTPLITARYPLARADEALAAAALRDHVKVLIEA